MVMETSTKYKQEMAIIEMKHLTFYLFFFKKSLYHCPNGIILFTQFFFKVLFLSFF